MKNLFSNFVLFILSAWGVVLIWLGISMSLEKHSMPFNSFVMAIFAGIISGVIVAYVTGNSIQARFIEKRNDDRLKQVRRFLDGGDYSKDECDRNIRILEGLDEDLHSESQYYLGILYLHGRRHITQDRGKASNLFKKAKENGHVEAGKAFAKMDSESS